MMPILFVLAVVLGFFFMLLSTWPVNYAARIAWGCWLVAALIWAFGKVGA